MGVHVVAPLGFGKIIYYGVTILFRIEHEKDALRPGWGLPVEPGKQRDEFAPSVYAAQ